MRNLTGVVNEPLTIYCPITGYPVTSLQWNKHGEKIQDLSTEGSLQHAKLNIGKISKAHEGEMSCSATDSIGGKVRNTMWITLTSRSRGLVEKLRYV